MFTVMPRGPSTPLCCARDDNRYVMFDLPVGLANDQSIMGDHSQEEQALMKIQDEWAEARLKGDSSYTRRIEADDCTIVWPDGRIVNKQGDLQSMTGDIAFKAHKGKHDLLDGKFVWTGTFVKQGKSMEGGRFRNHSGLGKVMAHSYR
jgi:hypothetical protein